LAVTLLTGKPQYVVTAFTLTDGQNRQPKPYPNNAVQKTNPQGTQFIS
jgi:hypothetical protein